MCCAHCVGNRERVRDVPRVSDCCGPCGRWCLVGVSGVEVLEVEDVNCRGRGWVWDLWVMLFPDRLQLEPEGILIK